MIHEEKNEKHLPIPVFSFLRPTNSILFLNHILLSMGCYSTEIDLMTHSSIRESFRYAKLIGNSNEEEDFHKYSNELFKKMPTECSLNLNEIF